MINTDISVNCMDPTFPIFKFYFHVLSFLVSQMVRVMAVIKLQRQKCVATLTSLLTDFSSICWLGLTLAYSANRFGKSITIICEKLQYQQEDFWVECFRLIRKIIGGVDYKGVREIMKVLFEENWDTSYSVQWLKFPLVLFFLFCL